MYISQLFEEEATSGVLVIYPGRFQPWHKGHRSVYEHLTRLFGRDNVFIATSNKVDPPRSPFSFAEKLQFMQLTGIPMDRVVETKDPYRALEIVQSYNPKTTRLIFAVSEKDMAEDPRFKFGYKKDGSPTYLQAMPNNPAEMQPFEQHGYVMTVPTVQFTVLGKPMRSATDVRKQFAEADDATQREIIKDLFGRYSPEIHSLMKHKITLNENYEYMPPGAGAGQTRRLMNKISAKDNKFIWKKPNQIGGSFTNQQLLDMGFKRSQYNSWGGTQAMWDRLLGIKEQQLNKPTPTAQEIIQKFKISPEELIAQLKIGVKVELEHTRDARTAYEIALDHLNERPDYYTKLMNAGLESIGEQSDSTNKKVNYREVGFNDAENYIKNRSRVLDLTPAERNAYNYGYSYSVSTRHRRINPSTGKPYIQFDKNGPYSPLINPIYTVPREEIPTEKSAAIAALRKKLSSLPKGSKVYEKYKAQLDALLSSDLTEVFDTKATGAWDNAPKWKGMEKFVFTASNGIQYRLDFLDPGIGPEEMGPESFDFALGLDNAVFDKILDRAKFVEFEQVNTKDPYGSGKQGIEGSGAAAEVFGSVVNAILTYIKKYKPSMLYFQAVEPNRRRLYTSMVNRLLKYLPGWGFERSGPADSMFAIYNTRLLRQPVVREDAAGVGVIAQNKKMAKDPRYSMSMTKDVKPGQDKKNLKAWHLIK